jgi:hypothetical protein
MVPGSRRRYFCLHLCLLDGARQQEKIFLSLSRYTKRGLVARTDILVFISVYKMVPGSRRRYLCLYLCLLDGAWQQEKIFFFISVYKMVPGSRRRYSCLYLCLLDDAWQQEKISCLYLDILKEEWQQEQTFLSLSLSTRWCLAAGEDIFVFISVYKMVPGSKRKYSCLYLDILKEDWQQEQTFLSLSLSTR